MSPDPEPTIDPEKLKEESRQAFEKVRDMLKENTTPNDESVPPLYHPQE